MALGDREPLNDDWKGKVEPTNTEKAVAQEIFERLVGKFDDRRELEHMLLFMISADPLVEKRYVLNRQVTETVSQALETSGVLETWIDIVGRELGLGETRISMINPDSVKTLIGTEFLPKSIMKEILRRFSQMLCEFSSSEGRASIEGDIRNSLGLSGLRVDQVMHTPLAHPELSIFELIEFLGDVAHSRVQKFLYNKEVATGALGLLKSSRNEDVRNRAREALEGKGYRSGGWMDPSPPQRHKLGNPFMDDVTKGCRNRLRPRDIL